MLKQILSPLASLRLTVFLIVLCIIMIYTGTIAQIDAGIWDVQKRYFHSLLVWIPLNNLIPFRNRGVTLIPGHFPFPGGYALGAALLVNLLAAHTLRFKATSKDIILIPAIALSVAIGYWLTPDSNLALVALFFLTPLPLLAAVAPLHGKRTGVIMIHLGLILLLVGEAFTSTLAVESQMNILNGESANYTADTRSVEIAVIDPSPSDHDHIVSISQKRLANGATIKDARLPFELTVDAFYRNTQRLGPFQAQQMKFTPPKAITAGSGGDLLLAPAPDVSGTDEGVNLPTAYVTLTRDGNNLGTYLLSTGWNPVADPQDVMVDGKPYRIQLRFKRIYKPYTLQLKKFTHDVYPGTDIPKDFASDVRLTDPGRGVDRVVKIWMNHPLRYHGDTLYQQSFSRMAVDQVTGQAVNPERTPPGSFKWIDTGTILQVVSNPSWVMPYSACAVGGFGLVLHFGTILLNFLEKNKKRQAARTTPSVPQKSLQINRPAAKRKSGVITVSDVSVAPTAYTIQPRTRFELIIPALLAVILVIYLVARAFPMAEPKGLDYYRFGEIPVMYEGRVQPLDSLARNSLRMLAGKERLELKEMTADGAEKTTTIPPSQWLLDMFTHRDVAGDYTVFRIDYDELKGFLDLDPEKKLFSYNDIFPTKSGDEKLQKVSAEYRRLPANSKDDDRFQRNFRSFIQRLQLFQTLSENIGMLYLVPPQKAGDSWKRIGEATQGARELKDLPETARAFVQILQDYTGKNTLEFNDDTAKYQQTLDQSIPRTMNKVRFEAAFNRFDPFTLCMAMYVGAFILICISWLATRVLLTRTAFALLIVAAALHTVGLIARIYISGRPPVTNLPSAAIFIAWGMVLLATGLEKVHKNGIGTLAASVAGFASLLLADRLSVDGDTMKVLVAVLDTNFWLATHVVIITLGYASTYLAGILGIFYVIRGLFTQAPLTADAVATRSPSSNPLLDVDLKTISRMIYGIVCFAILFSFVGTVLGGIWADQSWGRFWGWDPKENGAVLIVLWNALLLHARWCGLVKDRGFAVLAIGGNIVTTWSFFGTNLMGVGLHAYGFIEGGVAKHNAFILSQLILIALGTLPLKLWRSFKTDVKFD